MSLSNFLENLDKQSQKEKEMLNFLQKEKEKNRKEDNEFLDIFQAHYTKNMVQELNLIKESLRSKFGWDQIAGILPEQYKSFQIKIKLTPNFESNVNMIEITITASARNKLIQFIGVLPENTGIKSRVALNYLELPYDDFVKISIEGEIEKTLTKAFLKK